MILSRLKEYADDRLKLPPSMYGQRPVKWVLELDGEGTFRGFSMLTGERKTNDRGKILIAPDVVRASAIKPKLLADNAEYALGIPRESSQPERVRKCHKAFKELVDLCARRTGSQDVKAISNFLEKMQPDELSLPEDFDPSMNLTFRVDGRYPFQDKAVQEFWKEYTKRLERREPLLCHLCGDNPAEERMPAKIKGIPGGQPSGTALISANKEAFLSYGLHASQVGPTCRDCAQRFTEALNQLLRDDNSHMVIGGQVYVFWSKGEEFTPVNLLKDPGQNLWDFLRSDEEINLSVVDPDDPQQVKEILRSAFTGRKGSIDLETEGFYAAAFSGSGGRVVVRDWLETTIPEVKQNLCRFFHNCFLVYQARPFSIYSLAGATVRDPKDLSPRTLHHLLNNAIKGERLPEEFFYQAIRRNQAEQRVTAPRASLIKMYFLSNGHFLKEEEDMSALNVNLKDPAYLCGRLLAVLEEVQQGAQGSASVVDRFYGTASTAPATVFSRLISLSRHHLAKLKRDKPGYHVNLEKKLQEIMNGLREFPPVLTLQEQGLFALGYYHQRQERFIKTEKQIHKEESI